MTDEITKAEGPSPVSYSKSVRRDMTAVRMKNFCCRENLCRAMKTCVPSAKFRDAEIQSFYDKISSDCKFDADARPDIGDTSRIRCSGCRAAILRGIFLAVGSVSDPGKHEANLDLSFRDADAADSVGALLSGFGFGFRRRVRRGNIVLYMKSGDDIGGFFAEAGINRVLFDVSNEALISDVANFANRRANTDMHNLTLSTGASERVCDAIRALDGAGRLYLLDDALLDAAKLRIENPELSLSQLAAISPTGISKPTLANRLRRIVAIADEIKKEK